MSDKTVAAPGFSPRRLTHANLFVTELGRSMAFYNHICGFEEVAREPGISAGFLTNGNTHHDLGLMEIGTETRTGIGGYVQVAESRMKHAGLNHFGWELENEKQLVDAYHRAVAAGVKIHRTTDHQVSHSVYVFDPEGNLNEFYADAMTNWRSVFNPELTDLISSHWDPDSATPSETPKYNSTPDLRRVEDAAFHSLRITHAALVARDIDRLRGFYVDVAGLTPVAESADGDFICLKGTSAAYDLVLLAADDDLTPGLHHVSFEVDDDDLDRGERALADSGLKVGPRIDNAAKRSLFIKDPDGIGIEFCLPLDRRAAADLAAAGERAMRPYLV